MVDVSRVKEHTRITKSGTKTVKGYDRKKRLKKILAGVGATGLVATGLFLNRNRLKNVLNKAKSKVVDVEELGTKLLPASNQTVNLGNKLENNIKNKLSVIKQVTKEPKTSSVLAGNDIKLLKGSNPKLLLPAKERLRNTTPGIRNDVIRVGGKQDKIEKLFPGKKSAIKRDRTYLQRVEEKRNVADLREDKMISALEKDPNYKDLADRKSIAKLRADANRLETDVYNRSPVRKAITRSNDRAIVTTNRKLKVTNKGKNAVGQKKTLNQQMFENAGKAARAKLETVTIAEGIDGVIPGGGYLYKQARNIKSNLDRVERLSNELADNGDKLSSRRGFFKKAFKKAAVEGSKKPTEPLNVGKGAVQRGKDFIDMSSGKGSRRRLVRINGTGRERLNNYFRTIDEPVASEKGQIGRGINRLRKWLKYKSGNL